MSAIAEFLLVYLSQGKVSDGNEYVFVGSKYPAEPRKCSEIGLGLPF